MNSPLSLVNPLNAVGVRFRQMVACSAALCMFGIFAATPAAGQQEGHAVLAGIDPLKTVTGVGKTWKGFSLCPIPAGFFCPDADPNCTTSAGSDAINTGQIKFKGDPLGGPFGDADTIVERLGQANVSVKKVQDCQFGDCSDVCSCTPATVGIKIVALSLKGTAPVMVTYSGGQPPEEWTVRACLSDGPQDVGTMTIRHECYDGGTFDSTLKVYFKLIFSRPGRDDLTLEPGDPCAPIVFTAVNQPWVHEFAGALSVLAGKQVDGNCDGTLETLQVGTSNFVPGVTPDPCDPFCTMWGSCVTSDNKTKGEVPESTANADAKHTVTPPEPNGNGGNGDGGDGPAVSEWGMAVIVLLLLTGIAIKFGRRRAARVAA